MKLKITGSIRKIAIGLIFVLILTSINVYPVVRAETDTSIIIDNGDTGYSESGDWSDSGVKGYNDSSTRFSYTAGAYVTWTPDLTEGSYEVCIYKVVHSSSDRNAKIDVVYSGGTDTQYLNYTTGESGWITLGVYYFDGTTVGYVKNTRSADAIRADAVRFEKVMDPTIAVISSPDSLYSVSVDAEVEISFSNSMNADTIDTDSIILKESGSTISVDSVYLLSADGKVLTVKPMNSLKYNTDYTISVNNNALDEKGKRIYGIKEWSFHTKTESEESHESEVYEELLQNGGFEDGIGSWYPRPGNEDAEDNGGLPVGIDITEDTVNSGSKACLVTNRIANWASPTLDVTDIFKANSNGKYILSVSAKTTERTDTLMVVLELTVNGNRQWVSTAATSVNPGEFTKISEKKIVSWDGELEAVKLYVQSSVSGIKPDLYLDDFSIGVPEDQSDPELPMPDMSLRNEKTLVGAIRWDAWVGDRDTGNTAPADKEGLFVGQQVERSLTPEKYHFRLPWFASILDDGTIKADGAKQEIIDREIRYAMAAGIDYWAFCYYSGAMAEPRQMYLDSMYRNGMKWCYIFGGPFRDNDVLDGVIAEINTETYLTTSDGRPVIYLFPGVQIETADQFNNAWEEGKIKQQPYFIAMGASLGADDLIKAKGDALSAYTYSGTNGVPYENIIDGQLKLYERQKRYGQNGAQVVPIVSMGWDKRPRYDNPVSWELAGAEGFKDQWVEQPSNDEIAKSLEQALEWNEANKKNTVFNSVILYAWNEYDEGGWINPTLFELRDSGRPVRLDVIRDVLIKYKVKYTDTDGVPWAVNSINALAIRNVFENIGGTEFEPIKEITRAEFLAYLIRALGLYTEGDGNFSDIDDSAFYSDEIAIAKALGLTPEMAGNEFDPDTKITRQDVMVFAGKMLSMLVEEEEIAAIATEEILAKYTDRDSILSYARPYAALLVKAELIGDDGNEINPLGTFTRAEAAVLLHKILEFDKIQEKEPIEPTDPTEPEDPTVSGGDVSGGDVSGGDVDPEDPTEPEEPKVPEEPGIPAELKDIVEKALEKIMQLNKTSTREEINNAISEAIALIKAADLLDIDKMISSNTLGVILNILNNIDQKIQEFTGTKLNKNFDSDISNNYKNKFEIRNAIISITAKTNKDGIFIVTKTSIPIVQPKSGKKLEGVTAFDFKLYDEDGGKVELIAPVILKIPVENSKCTVVIHIKDDGTQEWLPILERGDGYVLVITTSFSIFVIADEVEAKDNADNLPKNSDNDNNSGSNITENTMMTLTPAAIEIKKSPATYDNSLFIPEFRKDKTSSAEEMEIVVNDSTVVAAAAMTANNSMSANWWIAIAVVALVLLYSGISIRKRRKEEKE